MYFGKEHQLNLLEGIARRYKTNGHMLTVLAFNIAIGFIDHGNIVSKSI